MDSKYLEYMAELELKAGFTLEELKKKKIELVKEYHPDKYHNQPERVKKLAEEKMKKINEAYDYLEKTLIKILLVHIIVMKQMILIIIMIMTIMKIMKKRVMIEGIIIFLMRMKNSIF